MKTKTSKPKYLVLDSTAKIFHESDYQRIRKLEKLQKEHQEECLKKQEQEDIRWRE